MNRYNQEWELSNPEGGFQRFIQAMKKKVEDGTDKHGDFTKWTIEDFRIGLHQEIMEYYEAIKNGKNPFEIAGELVDIANLAFMQHWTLTHELIELSQDMNKHPRTFGR